jgi:hypothetical protein
VEASVPKKTGLEVGAGAGKQSYGRTAFRLQSSNEVVLIQIDRRFLSAVNHKCYLNAAHGFIDLVSVVSTNAQNQETMRT